VVIRGAVPADIDRIVAVADQWWGRPMSGVLQRLFLDHFYDTSLVADSSAPRAPGETAGWASPSAPRSATTTDPVATR
jgi:hypothetical protein